MEDEIIYFEVNHWAMREDYPEQEPFPTWMDDYNLDKYLGNDEWVKENKICVVMFPVDMSMSFMVTAPKSWVEKVCPAILLEENSKFIRHPEEGEETPEGKFQGYFLPYTEEYIGKIDNSLPWI